MPRKREMTDTEVEERFEELTRPLERRGPVGEISPLAYREMVDLGLCRHGNVEPCEVCDCFQGGFRPMRDDAP